jgi:probable phosphoglycerate mutase
MQRWLDSVEVAPPGGESFSMVRERVNRGRLELLKKYHGKRIVIVSHVTPIKLMAGIAVDAPLESVYRMELRPGSISSMMWFADGNNSLMSFSEASHLRGIDTFPFV